MKKYESRVVISKKFKKSEIQAFMSSEEIGADTRLEHYHKALSEAMLEPLTKSIVEIVGNPTMLFTKSSLEKEVKTALEQILDKAMQSASDEVIEEMKKATVTVAALPVPR